jgi:hypothetical protein
MRFVYITDVKSGLPENSPRDWRRSTLSMANGDCIEVGNPTGGLIWVRDSKNHDGPVLGFGLPQWSSFMNSIRDGVVDPA